MDKFPLVSSPGLPSFDGGVSPQHLRLREKTHVVKLKAVKNCLKLVFSILRLPFHKTLANTMKINELLPVPVHSWSSIKHFSFLHQVQFLMSPSMKEKRVVFIHGSCFFIVLKLSFLDVPRFFAFVLRASFRKRNWLQFIQVERLFNFVIHFTFLIRVHIVFMFHNFQALNEFFLSKTLIKNQYTILLFVIYNKKNSKL